MINPSALPIAWCSCSINDDNTRGEKIKGEKKSLKEERELGVVSSHGICSECTIDEREVYKKDLFD